MRGRDPMGWEAWQPAEWPVPARVRAGHTLRRGGVSLGAWGDPAGGGGLNLGAQCGDDHALVEANRARLAARLPGEPVWLEQVHGVRVHRAEHMGNGVAIAATDASVTDRAGVVLAVLSADCLPVLLSNREGTVVGAAHAGWRRLYTYRLTVRLRSPWPWQAFPCTSLPSPGSTSCC